MSSVFKGKNSVSVEELGGVLAHLCTLVDEIPAIDIDFLVRSRRIDRRILKEEIMYLTHFGIVFATSVELGLHNPKYNAVTDVCAARLAEMTMCGTLPTYFMEKLSVRGVDYADAIKPFKGSDISAWLESLGTVFAGYFGLGKDVGLATMMGMYLRQVMESTINMLRHVKITY